MTLLASLLAPPAAIAQVHVITPGPDSGDLLVVDELTGEATTVLQAVELGEAVLVGYPNRDRLLRSLPRPTETATDRRAIELTGGGRLHRVGTAGGAGLLLIPDTGPLGLPLWLPGIPLEGLDRHVHVDPTSSFALVSLTAIGGGDVLRVDLASGAVRNLTSGLPPLAVDGASVRTSDAHAWFVAGDVLYHADLQSAGEAVPVTVDAPAGHVVLPELLLAGGGRHLAFLTEGDDVGRHVHLVDGGGDAARLTDAPGSFSLPRFEDDLGPNLAVSPDGSTVAFVEVGDTDELFVRRFGAGAGNTHVTHQADFPDYLDAIGPLAMPASGDLCFFVGDEQLSGVGSDMIGMGEMYEVHIAQDGSVALRNASLTNGIVYPPFDQPAELYFTEAILDPVGRHFILIGEDPVTEAEELSRLPVPTEGAPGFLQVGLDSLVEPLLSGLDEDPEVRAFGNDVIVFAAGESTTGVYQLSSRIGPGRFLGLGSLPMSEEDEFVFLVDCNDAWFGVAFGADDSDDGTDSIAHGVFVHSGGRGGFGAPTPPPGATGVSFTYAFGAMDTLWLTWMTGAEQLVHQRYDLGDLTSGTTVAVPAPRELAALKSTSRPDPQSSRPKRFSLR